MTLGDVEYGGCKPRIKLINVKKGFVTFVQY